MKQLQDLFSRFRPAPSEWLGSNGSTGTNEKGEVLPRITPLYCDNYDELLEAWKNAIKCSDSFEISLTTVLATVASTRLLEDQVWVRLIGKAGTLKTTLCEALAANDERIFPTSLLTGIHSGYTGPETGGKDSSMIPKMMNKTTIINEGDMILKAPNRDQIMAELRDLYSGMARANYRNGKNVEYPGLRTSLIIAGTNSLRALNRSALGDRFLDCIIYEKATDQAESDLVRSILGSSLDSMLIESNGHAETQLSPEKALAYQKTAGFITYIRANIAAILKRMKESGGMPSSLFNDCESLGKLVACMRTRAPESGEEPTEKELHVRLSKQLLKVAICTAAVMGTEVTPEVMRRTAKVAKDTCYGHTFDICKALFVKPQLDDRGLSVALRGTASTDSIKKLTKTLVAIGCIRMEATKSTESGLGRKIAYSLTLSTKNMLTKLKELWQDEI